MAHVRDEGGRGVVRARVGWAELGIVVPGRGGNVAPVVCEARPPSPFQEPRRHLRIIIVKDHIYVVVKDHMFLAKTIYDICCQRPYISIHDIY